MMTMLTTFRDLVEVQGNLRLAKDTDAAYRRYDYAAVSKLEHLAQTRKAMKTHPVLEDLWPRPFFAGIARVRRQLGLDPIDVRFPPEVFIEVSKNNLKQALDEVIHKILVDNNLCGDWYECPCGLGVLRDDTLSFIFDLKPAMLTEDAMSCCNKLATMMGHSLPNISASSWFEPHGMQIIFWKPEVRIDEDDELPPGFRRDPMEERPEGGCEDSHSQPGQTCGAV